MTTIQWRLKRKFRTKPEQERWQKHSEVRDAEVKQTLVNYNDADVHFEYRQEPRKELK